MLAGNQAFGCLGIINGKGEHHPAKGTQLGFLDEVSPY